MARPQTQPCPLIESSPLVLNFLQGIENAGDDVHNSPPQSLVDHEEYQSRHSQEGSRSPGSHASRRILSPKSKQNSDGVLTNLARSPVSYDNGQPKDELAPEAHVDRDDADSNEQEGRTSEPDEDTAQPVVLSWLLCNGLLLADFQKAA